VRIAVLGTGNMGRAILDGLLASESGVSLIAYDVIPAACATLSKKISVVPPEAWGTPENIPDAVVLAVKPADIVATGKNLHSIFKKASQEPLIISIAAGVNLQTLQGSFSKETRVCRVMPNTPAKVGLGMSAYACSESCSSADRALVNMIFAACGRVTEVPEKLLHAVTGLSGSGPAYVFLFIEALIEGGVTAGLPLAVARECAVQTVLGAASMVQQSTDHPGALKAAVMSPGGTTAAGLRAMEKGAFKHCVIDAVLAATERSAQLGA